MNTRTRLTRPVAVVASLALVLAACGGDDSSSDTTAAPQEEESPNTFECDAVDVTEVGGELVIYSGRNEELVGPLIDCFAEKAGIDVDIRYSGSSEEAAQLIAVEGDASPADVFFSQSPGSTGFLEQEGRLISLPADIIEAVPAEYRSREDDWVGTSGRVRALVYNTDEVAEADLPTSVFDLTDPAWKGKIGVAPSNGSFQDFVSAMIATEGEEATSQFLADLAANEPRIYEGNTPIVDAVGRGEVAVGLVNHYYAAQQLSADPDLPIANHFFSGDIGSIILVASAAILDTAGEQQPQAEAFVRFLLSEAAQNYFVNTTKEYPAVATVAGPAGQPSLDEIGAPDEDLNLLGGLLETTVTLIEESGLASG
jgi:iron(III) transport system substrate-binding protein